MVKMHPIVTLENALQRGGSEKQYLLRTSMTSQSMILTEKGKVMSESLFQSIIVQPVLLVGLHTSALRLSRCCDFLV